MAEKRKEAAAATKDEKNKKAKKASKKKKNNKKYARKKTLADKVIQVGHARIRQCFDWDAEEDSKEKKKKKKSETENDEQKVDYDNEGLQMYSPPQKSPKIADEERFIQDVFVHSIPHWTVETESTWPVFTTMAALNITSCISFPWIMAKHGGWYFLLPFTLSTLLVTFPLNAMQYFLGQFTSAPPIIIYYRMAPIFMGIGILVNTMLYISTSGVKLDHRFLSLSFEILFSLLSKRSVDLRMSRVYGTLRGYLGVCEGETMYINGKCFPVDDMVLRDGTTDRVYTQLEIQKFVQKDNVYVEFVKPDLEQKIFESQGTSSHYVFGTFVFALIAFCCSLKDLRTFTATIKNFIFYGTIVSSVCLLLYVVNTSGYEPLQFFDVIGADFTKILQPDTWVVALVQSFVIFSTADGTFFGLGMINKFKNNFFRATLNQTLLSLVLLIVIGTSFGVTTCAGISIDNFNMEKRSLTFEDMRNHIYNDNDIFKYLHIYFFQNLALKWTLLTFAFFITTWQIFGQMVLANMVVSTMYRLIRSLVRLPEFLVRYITLHMHYTILGATHIIIFKQARQLPILLGPYVALLQVIAVLLFSPRKMLAAVYSTSNKPDLVFLYRLVILVFYLILIPAVLLMAIVFDILSTTPPFWKIVFFPLALAFYSIIYHHMSSGYKGAITETREWGPATVIERKEHLKAERATCPDLM